MWENLITDEVSRAGTSVLGDALTPPAREAVARNLYDWLVRAPKASVDNLEARLEQMRKRIDAMTAGLVVGLDNGELVVTATGDAETVLRMFELGTDWFPPAPVEDMIFAVLA